MNPPAPAFEQTSDCELQSLIGGGSSGEVWRGTYGDQPVAVKFLKQSLLTSPQRDKHLQRFRTEILSLQRLTGTPNIPRLITYALDVERPYLIMQFIEGEAFAELLASGQMSQIPLRQRLSELQGIAQALDAAHQANVLHRDIKPANLRGTQPAYLLDFSVALDLVNADDDRAVQVGTRLYRPPQLGDPAAPFRDRFAYAVVCYEVLFGRHPFFLYHEIASHANRLEAVAYHRLTSRTWYTPSTLQTAALPPNLSGAHLAELDTIFQHAFEGDNFSSTAALVAAVRAAIDVPENHTWIDTLPPVVQAQHIASDFTDAEVQMPALQTHTGIRVQFNWRFLAAALIVVVLLLILLAAKQA